MNNFSVLECPVYFDKTNMLDMLSLCDLCLSLPPKTDFSFRL